MINHIKQKLAVLTPGQRQVANNAVYSTTLRFGQQAFGMVTIYVLARLLTQTEFGQYQFILSLIALFTFCVLPELQVAIMQSVSRGFPGTYRKAVRLSFVGGLIGGGLLFLLGLYKYFISHDTEMAYGIFIAAIFFPFSQGLSNWRGAMAGMEKYSTLLKLDGSQAVLAPLVIAAICPLFPGNMLAPLMIVLASRCILDVAVTLKLFNTISKDAPVEQGSVAYGIQYSLNSVVYTLAMQLDKFLLFYFISPAAVAIYFAAERINDLVNGALVDAAAVMGPRFARHKNYTERVHNIIFYYSLASALLILFFAYAIMPWILVFLFGDQYEKAIGFAKALLCISAFSIFTKIQTRFIRSKLDGASLQHIVITASLIRIASSAALVPVFGMVGAVVSNLLYNLAFAAIVHSIMKRSYPIAK